MAAAERVSFKRDRFLLALYLLFLFGTTPLMPQLWSWAASWMGRGRRFLPEASGGLSFLLVFATLLRGAKRFPLKLLMFALVGGLFFFSMDRVGRPVEKIHFTEYGWLSFFIFRVLRHCQPSLRRYGGAFAGVCLIGLLDECLQGFLPNRVFDLRDLWFNALAGTFGLVIVALAWDPLLLR